MKFAALFLLLDVTLTTKPVRQWAIDARASTEYSNPAWAA